MNPLVDRQKKCILTTVLKQYLSLDPASSHSLPPQPRDCRPSSPRDCGQGRSGSAVAPRLRVAVDRVGQGRLPTLNSAWLWTGSVRVSCHPSSPRGCGQGRSGSAADPRLGVIVRQGRSVPAADPRLRVAVGQGRSGSAAPAPTPLRLLPLSQRVYEK